ncbi:MAG: VWA domain-containing protein [Opitutae bacterium]|nr:VWA domain-containing protein [Opitutae bacterium]
MNFDSIIWLFVLALLVPSLVLFYFFSERRAWKKLSQFAGSSILQQLTDSYSPILRNTKSFLIVLVVVLACLALARPQLGHTYREEKRRGIDFIIALDVSRSMLAEDIKPNRLQRAKFAILDLLDRTEGDRVALLAFAGSAFLQCPLTLDYDAFRQTLDSVDTGLLATQGTDIAGAILEAQGSFAEDDHQKVLVMISDGEDLEAEGILQARKAGEAGITIYTVGVGSPDGELIPFTSAGGVKDWLRDPQGELVRTKLDETALRQIAVATDGAYVPLGASGQGLNYVYEHGLSLVPEEEREAHLRKLPTERYQWPLALAVLFLLVEMLLGTRRVARSGFAVTGTRLATVATLGLLSLTPVAVDAFTFGGGKSLYKQGKFEDARELFQKNVQKVPESAVNHYNLGATQFRIGEFEPAVESLSKALELEKENPEFQSDVYESRGFVRFQHGETLRENEPARAVELWTQGLLDYGSALSLNDKQGERYDKLLKEFQLFKEKIQDLSYRNGIRHYNAGEYASSIDSFNEVLKEVDKASRDEILYNLANSRFRLGEQQLNENPQETIKSWEQSLKDYTGAIEVRVDDTFPQAQKNYEIVQKRLEALKEQMKENPEQNQDSQNKENENKDQEQKNQDSKENNNSSKSNEGQNKNQSPSKEKAEKEKAEKEKAEKEKAEKEKGNPNDNQKEKAGKDGEENKGETPEASQQAQAIPGRMTQEQAMQLLEQLRAFERKLPLGNLENIRSKDRNDGREGRNW